MIVINFKFSDLHSAIYLLLIATCRLEWLFALLLNESSQENKKKLFPLSNINEHVLCFSCLVW